MTSDLEAKKRPGLRTNLSPKALEHARAFLSALFMGLRTAQIHDTSNSAFLKAVDTVHRCAEALYASTGGFQVQFVEESCFLNSVRLRFEGGAYQAMRSLRHLLESQELGGITMQAPPTPSSVRTLILLFAKSIHGDEKVTREDVQRAQIGILGVQRFSDGGEFRVDRRVFAVQSYAKLLLALKEQFERAQLSSQTNWTSSTPPPRLRVVRVIQDMIELCGDRADFVLRLALNAAGASKEELYGTNTCLLSLALGHSLAIPRNDLVDIGVAALFHPVGFRLAGSVPQIEMGHVHTSLARMFQESGVGRSAHLRTLIVGECLIDPDADRSVHPYSRIVRVAAHFVARLIGYPNSEPVDPMTALATLLDDPRRLLDPMLTDLLLNVLRAYPPRVELVLDSGRSGIVVSHLGGSRWDRPLVRVLEEDGAQNFDLMVQEEGRFVDRVAGTLAFMGKAGAAIRILDELVFPQVLDSSALIPEEPELLSPEDLVEVPAVPGEAIEALVRPVDFDDPLDQDTIEEEGEPVGKRVQSSMDMGDVTDRQEAPIDLDLDLEEDSEEERVLDVVPIGEAYDFGVSETNTDKNEIEPSEE